MAFDVRRKAESAWAVIVASVGKRTPITYRDLGRAIGMSSHGHRMNAVLDVILQRCAYVSWACLAIAVVLKKNGLPSPRGLPAFSSAHAWNTEWTKVLAFPWPKIPCPTVEEIEDAHIRYRERESRNICYRLATDIFAGNVRV